MRLPAPAARPPALPAARRAAPAAPRSAPPRVLRLPPPTAAAFDTLTASLSTAWDSIKKDGALTPANIKAPLRDVRRALLEADVALPVVRQFVARVEAAALGVKVTKGVAPDQQLVKVVYDELKSLMGGEREDLNVPTSGPAVILLAGLQGVGKTTAAGKLASLLRSRGQRVLLVAADVYRPAAIDQLKMLGGQLGVDVFAPGADQAPEAIAAAGAAKGRAEKYDAVVVDTAGRLTVDDAMMAELRACAEATSPTDTLLVVDAMTGQEAATLTAAFAAATPLTGAILTKLDGDSRGGAALSVRAVSGAPIKFVGTGEKLDALEPFYPDRLAGRILGMGDVLTLVEKAEAAVSEADAERLTKRMMSAKFDFDDFLEQYRMVTGMGGMGAMLKMIPGVGAIGDKQMAAAEKQFKIYESMIQSMTAAERKNPDLLARVPSRRRRVARGSGRAEADVAGLIAMFAGMRSRMRSLTQMRAGGGAGAPGMPSMTNDELMRATIDSAAAGVAPGKVRRRRPRAANGKGFGGKAVARNSM
jgi:signal recognition particle subunit SRP54